MTSFARIVNVFTIPLISVSDLGVKWLAAPWRKLRLLNVLLRVNHLVPSL
jgi:hypothetical protein